MGRPCSADGPLGEEGKRTRWLLVGKGGGLSTCSRYDLGVPERKARGSGAGDGGWRRGECQRCRAQTVIVPREADSVHSSTSCSLMSLRRGRRGARTRAKATGNQTPSMITTPPSSDALHSPHHACPSPSPPGTHGPGADPASHSPMMRTSPSVKTPRPHSRSSRNSPT